LAKNAHDYYSRLVKQDNAGSKMRIRRTYVRGQSFVVDELGVCCPSHETARTCKPVI